MRSGSSMHNNNMTVEIWPVSTPSRHSAGGSPRFSFSRDLLECESGREHDSSDGSFVPGSPATSDFDFCIAGEGCDQEPSSADELFSDGRILPIPLQSRNQSVPTTQPTNCALPPQTPRVPPLPPTEPALPKQMIGRGADAVELEKTPPVAQKPSTSFWKFGRSSSLNCGRVGCGKGNGHSHMANFICSTTLLTRSKSTGSSNHNPSPNSQQKHQRHQPRKTTGSRSSARKEVSRTNSNRSTSSTPSSNSSYYHCSFHGGNSGVRISPVLNVPHSCIPMGGGRGNGLFGLGRLLCIGKEKNGRRQRSLFSPPQAS